METPKLYLAGPEVFLPNALEVGERKQDLCKDYGFRGLFPLDNKVDLSRPGASKLIFEANVGLLDQANGVIANLTPFRGISADVGTVWEVGYARGRGIPVFGYTYDSDTLKIRMDDQVIDSDGFHIEDFGLFDNLMIPYSLQSVQIHESLPGMKANLTSMFAFTECLIAARRHFFD